jgi:DNA-binding NtrC family response regulator
MTPDHVVIIITGYGTVNNAVEAMKLGAFDFIAKPLKDDLVRITVQRAVSYAQLRDENVHTIKTASIGKPAAGSKKAILS